MSLFFSNVIKTERLASAIDTGKPIILIQINVS